MLMSAGDAVNAAAVVSLLEEQQQQQQQQQQAALVTCLLRFSCARSVKRSV
jgi:hypothetical protein